MDGLRVWIIFSSPFPSKLVSDYSLFRLVAIHRQWNGKSDTDRRWLFFVLGVHRSTINSLLVMNVVAFSSSCLQPQSFGSHWSVGRPRILSCRLMRRTPLKNMLRALFFFLNLLVFLKSLRPLGSPTPYAPPHFLGCRFPPASLLGELGVLTASHNTTLHGVIVGVVLHSYV